MHRDADRDQVLELLRVRSIYHLKEADPTTWVVPRLPVRAKAALMELQYDEYGAGDPEPLHAQLFAGGMAASGLSAEYGAYVDEAPLEILEQNNAMSLFGLHRRLRGAAIGHLAAFEATSSLPSRRMAQGLERLDFPAELVEYYTEHVEADAVHEQLAVRTICGACSSRRSPTPPTDVWFGAFTCLDLEDRFARSDAGQLGGPRDRPELEHPDVILCPGGPMLLRGDHAVEDDDGIAHRTTRPISAVCRCGKSSSQALVRRHPQGAPGRATP